MARKKKNASAPIGWLFAAVALAVLAVTGWQYRAALQAMLNRRSDPAMTVPAAAPAPPPAIDEGKNAGGTTVQVSGRLQVRPPPRDAQLGVTAADAVILIRKVEMYQWREQCDGANCRYDAAWSDRHVDSSRFRSRSGHENAQAPFVDARFVAAEVRLGELTIDPELVIAQHPAKDFAVSPNALPPNLAATFSVIDGVLYAGGDAAKPQPGTLRISYRIVPAGEVSLSGVRRGSKLEAR